MFSLLLLQKHAKTSCKKACFAPALLCSFLSCLTQNIPSENHFVSVRRFLLGTPGFFEVKGKTHTWLHCMLTTMLSCIKCVESSVIKTSLQIILGLTYWLISPITKCNKNTQVWQLLQRDSGVCAHHSVGLLGEKNAFGY